MGHGALRQTIGPAVMAGNQFQMKRLSWDRARQRTLYCDKMVGKCLSQGNVKEKIGMDFACNVVSLMGQSWVLVVWAKRGLRTSLEPQAQRPGAIELRYAF